MRGERGAQREHGWGMEGTAEPQRWWERWGARDCSTWQRCFWHVCSPFLIILRTLLTFKSQLCAQWGSQLPAFLRTRQFRSSSASEPFLPHVLTPSVPPREGRCKVRDVPRVFVEHFGAPSRTQTSAATAQALSTAVNFPHIAMDRHCSLRHRASSLALEASPPPSRPCCSTEPAAYGSGYQCRPAPRCCWKTGQIEQLLTHLSPCFPPSGLPPRAPLSSPGLAGSTLPLDVASCSVTMDISSQQSQ